ncbi:MAG: GHKL domain-containing protein [Cytophagia bacterium]|nr:GHKL domain-containing protein [Cytophagia bacterium]
MPPSSQCFKGFILLALFTSIVTCAKAQPYYALYDSANRHRVDAYLQILVDETAALKHTDILKDEVQKKFVNSKGDLKFGYTKATIWLKLAIKKTSSEAQWLVELPAPFLEFVDFYQLTNEGKWVHHQSGYYRAQSKRSISHTAHLEALVFGADSISHLYIQVAGESPKTFPVYVIEKEAFYQKTRFEDIGYGIFFGILVVMFFYNLVIYLTLKQTNYLLYICTIVCTFFIFASATGYAGKYFWPENPEWNFYAGRMSLPVLTIFLAIFTIRFLEVKQYSKTMYYILYALPFLGLVAGVLTATGIMSSASNNLISISTLIYLSTGIVCRIKGNRTASFFIAAWSFYLFGGLLLTLRNSGVLVHNFWTTHFVEIGAVLETTIIAIALGDRYRRYKEEKEEIQLQALKVQQEANEQLELKVKERTEELQQTLDTIKLQKEVIEDKNAELDAFFYRISHDLKGPIASLLGLNALAMIDIEDKMALEYVKKQHSQVERLNQIITGLINLTRLNNATLQREPIDFNRLINGCIEASSSLESFDRVTFKREIEIDTPYYTEWTLLNAIVQNLIENAVKYCREDNPYVHITISTNQNGLEIKVKDNGSGIPEEYQSRIFEMFYRANQHAPGSGLGLYILKRSVDRLQGTIEVESKVGEGSCFTVKLPTL